MATLRKKRKLTAITREIQEKNPRNGQSRNTSVPRITKNISHKFMKKLKVESLKKLSPDFSWTEPRILGALYKLEEFLLNPQIRTHFGAVRGTFRNTNVENQGTNEDDSQSDPHPEAGLFRSQTTQNSGPEVGLDMVTGGSEEIRNGHDMVTEVTEEIPSCSSGISSGKQKKARSTSQPQFHSEKTPATIEADQILLAPFNRWRLTAILPMSLTTTTESQNCLIPSRQQCNFDGKSEKLNCLKIYFKRV